MIDKLEAMAGKINGWILSAIAFKDKLLAPLSAAVKSFYDMSLRVFNAVNSVVSSVKNFISSTANSLINIAKDIAGVGVNIMRTISAIASLPGHLKSALMNVAGAFNETACILKNSLKPRKVFEDYDGIYGSSNCSSTSGGRQSSSYTNMNAFSLMQDKRPVTVSTAAQNSISDLNRSDPVLRPIALEDMGGKLDSVSSGINLDIEK